MYTSQDRHIKVGQFNTRYWVEGDGETPVLLIHGLGSFIEDWTLCFPVLAAQHRVIAVDLPGHGRTDKHLSASYHMPDLARFIKDFLTALRIERAHIVGHSLGGAVASQFAITYPDVVERLVLVSSAGLGKQVSMGFRLLSVPILGERLSRPSRSGTEQMLRSFVYDETVPTEEDIEIHYQMGLLPGVQPALLKTLRSSCSLFGQSPKMYKPIVDGLASIQKPALIVWGQQDPALPVAHARIAKSILAHAQVQIIDQCGHNPVGEHPQTFNSSLLEFLDD